MRRLSFYSTFAVCCIAFNAAQSPPSLTQRQACAQFTDAVVRIEAGGQSRGTGFIVSPDGFVLTASHVIRDNNGEYFSAITIKMPSGSVEFAKPATPITLDNVGQDFALLKVDGYSKLPFLPLGAIKDVAVGADATIIGYPFSAITIQDKNVFTKFCLSAAFAATSVETITIEGTNKTPKGSVPVKKDVKVDVIYFQGPSVKGLSGSPIIARDGGHVVGIVSVKLSGIGSSLMGLKQQTATGLGRGISISGMEPGKAVNDILTVLDNQLANGLGAAVGIDDPKYVLTKTQRKPKGQNK